MPAIAAVLMVSTWFRPGEFVAAGDIGPFIRDNAGTEIGSLWNHQSTGTGSPSLTHGSVLDVAVSRLAELFLVPQQAQPVAQWVLFCLVMVMAATSTVYLARVWYRNPVAGAFAGVFAVANTYVLALLPNLLTLVAHAVVCTLSGMLLRRARGARISPLVFALASTPIVYVSVNPPTLAVVTCAVLVTALSAGPLTGGSTRLAVGLLLRALPALVLFNLWWVLQLLFSLHGGGGVTVATEINPLAWAWTSTHSSIPNVVNLTGHWAWGLPGEITYMPYAAGLEDSAVERTLRWGLPVLALLGFCFPPRSAGNRSARPLRLTGLALIPLIFLTKGMHEPFSEVNVWIYTHVPGFWLFREPVSKFGLFIVIIYALLAGAALQRLLETGPNRVARTGGLVLALTAATAVCAYPLPMWNGESVSLPKGILPSARQKVPAAWYTLADQVNSSPLPGKALELPVNESSYQVFTTWGFYGVNNVPQQLLTRPFLQRLPGGYYDTAPTVALLYSGIQNALLAGDADRAGRGLQALGVSHVVIRKDLRPLNPAAPLPDSAVLAETMKKVRGARQTGTTPVADLVEINTGSDHRIQAASTGTTEYTTTAADPLPGPKRTVSTLLAQPAGVPLLTGTVTAKGGGSLLRFPASGSVSVAGSGGNHRLTSPGRELLALRPDVERHPDGDVVTFTDAVAPKLNGEPLATGPALRFPVRAEPEAVLVNDQRCPWRPGEFVFAFPGDRITVLTKGSRAPAGSGTVPQPLADPLPLTLPSGPSRLAVELPETPDLLGAPAPDLCGQEPEAEPSVTSARDPQGRNVVTLAAKSAKYSACLRVPSAGSVRAGAEYRVSFSYRAITGQVSSVWVAEQGSGLQALTAPLTSSSSWTPFSGTFTASPGATGFDVRLAAHRYTIGGAPEVEIRGIRLQPVIQRTLRLDPVDAPAPAPTDGTGTGTDTGFAATVTRNTPARFDVALRGLRGSGLLILPEGFDPGWRLTGLPSGWTARHTEAAGYANAWILTGSGNAEVRLSHAPTDLLNRLSTAAAVLSFLLLATSATLAFSRRRTGSTKG